MEKEILEILKRLESKVDNIEFDVKELKSDVKELNRKVDNIYDQTADLTEYRTSTSDNIEVIKSDVKDIKKDLCFVEEATAKNWQDITRLKAIK
ncbi:MAG: hypothetical protein ACRC7N_21120 [Clostridium sp.]